MKNEMLLKQIGKIGSENGRTFIELAETYRPGLTNIEGFSHLSIIWWGHLSDSDEGRAILVGEKPYTKGPEKLGVFATRSPFRPNPVLITNVSVQEIDYDKGRIYTFYIDAEEGTPVLDIKPYHLTERIKECSVPEWSKHWPKWYEDAGEFDWESEFNF
jgi:tRNA-Thr(GGU) m(6)t(6)A37 methyltransferase TsaA